MTDCNELMSKLNAIEAKLNALDDKYIPKSQRGAIVSEGADKGKALSLAILLPMLGAFITDGELQDSLKNAVDRVARIKADRAADKAAAAKAEAAKMIRRTELEAAKEQLKKDYRAQIRDQAETQKSYTNSRVGKAKADLEASTNAKIQPIKAVANQAKTIANDAKKQATGVKALYEQLNSRFTGFQSSILKKVDDIGLKAGKALSTALDSMGISKAARGLAGDALRMAGRALVKILNILIVIETILSLLNAIDLRNRMKALELRMGLFEKELGNLLSILGRISNRVNGAEQLARQAQNVASFAESIAVSARANANEAKNVALSAKNQAIAAVAQIAVVSAISIAASGLAGRAYQTAQQALRQKTIPGRNGIDGKPGPRGLPGIMGRPGRNGINGQPGRRGLPGIMGRPGRNGIDGKPGPRGLPGISRPGRNGINGQPGPRGLPGIMGRPGRNGLNGVDGKMNPTDTALLRRIDANTTSTRNVQQVHVVTSQETNALAQRTKDAIGVDGLPVSVPDQIAKQNPIQKNLFTLAELHLWQVEQLDGVMGRWPQQVPIPTPTGMVNIGMPNMAEAVSELVGMMISQQVTATQILNTTSRTLAQAGSATQQAHLAHLTSKANADFLGYENRTDAVDIPLTYTPGLNPFEGFLNESTAKIKGFRNTDSTDIKAIFAELLQAAAIIRAVYWRKLDTRSDLKKQIQRNIKGSDEFLDEAAQAGNDTDWKEYLRQVEQGFRDQTGDQTPYGRNPTEGPDIKDHSKGKDGK